MRYFRSSSHRLLRTFIGPRERFLVSDFRFCTSFCISGNVPRLRDWVRLRDMLTPILTDPFVELPCVFYLQFFSRVICVLPVFSYAVEYRHQLVDKGNDAVHCCLFGGKPEEVLNGRFDDDRWKEVGNTEGWPQKVSIICAAGILFLHSNRLSCFFSGT